jgi:hypothetical protein
MGIVHTVRVAAFRSLARKEWWYWRPPNGNPRDCHYISGSERCVNCNVALSEHNIGIIKCNDPMVEVHYAGELPEPTHVLTSKFEGDWDL